jgi:hypothetical protein
MGRPHAQIPPTGTKFGAWEFLGDVRFNSLGDTEVLLRCPHMTAWRKLGNLRRANIRGCKRCFSDSLFLNDPLRRRLRIIAATSRARCQNPKHKRYAAYGGRGIEWRFTDIDACEAYLRTLPNVEDASLELDRIDTNGHYSPGNLRFVTLHENILNKRNTTVVVWQGERMSMSAFAARFTELSHKTALNRYLNGVSLEALTKCKKWKHS